MLSREASLGAAAQNALTSSTAAQEQTPPLEIRGKAALVTGGAAGLGAAIAKALLSAGAKVAVLDMDAVAGERLVKELREAAGDSCAIFLHADVTDFELLQEAFQKVKEAFNGLDIVINNAGVGNEVDWQRMIDVNVKGVLGGTLLAQRLAARGARVLNVASVAGLGAFPCAPAYSASKHAAIAACRCYGAPEHTERTGVSVVAACPGPCDTPLLRSMAALMPEPWQGQQFDTLAEQFGITSPEQMAESVVHVLRVAASGSVWACHQGSATPVTFPQLV